MKKDSSTTKLAKIFIACCLCFGGSIGLISNCFGIFYSPIINELRFSVKDLSFMATIGSISSALFSTSLVKLMKKYKLGSIMAFGLTICILMYIMMTFSNKLWQFYIAKILIGIGSCCCSIIPISCIICDNFENNAGTILGITTAVSGIVGVIFNPICSKIIVDYNWKIAMLFIATLLLIFSLPASISLRTYNSIPVDKEKATSKFSIDITFILIAIVASLLSMSCCFISHISYYGVTNGYSLENSATMVSFVMAGNMLFKIIMGWMIDHLGTFKAVTIGIFMAFCGIFSLCFTNNFIMICLSCLFYGAISSCVILGNTNLCQSVYKNEYTDRYSKISVVTSVTSAFSTTGVGIVYDTYSSYTPIIIIVSVFLIIALIGVFILKRVCTSSE